MLASPGGRSVLFKCWIYPSHTKPLHNRDAHTEHSKYSNVVNKTSGSVEALFLETPEHAARIITSIEVKLNTATSSDQVSGSQILE